MPAAKLQILYEDNHLLALNKPPGVPTMGVAAGRASLVALAKQYIKHRYRKPGNVYLGVVSRLDAAASGVLVFARTSKAAARLSEQFRDRSVEKTYWAVVSGAVEPAGQWVDWMMKDERQQRMIVVEPSTSGALEARLNYRVLGHLPRGTWVEIALVTGRKHQIRLQFASRGAPLLGERKYAVGAPFDDHALALHARRLVFRHPVKNEPIELVAPLPPAWRALGIGRHGE